jgi:hypothetical protein
MYIASYIARLANTLFYTGYIPEDGTAQYDMYQVFDCMGLVMACKTLWSVTHPRYGCMKPKEKWYVVPPMMLACFVAAVFTESNANQNWILDVLWMFSLFCESVAIAPQLWIVSQIGSVETITSHFILFTVLARVATGFFWVQLQTFQPITGHFLFGVVVASLIHTILCADYMYFFVKSFFDQSHPDSPSKTKGRLLLPKTSFDA